MPRKIPAHVQGELAKRNLATIQQNKKPVNQLLNTLETTDPNELEKNKLETNLNNNIEENTNLTSLNDVNENHINNTESLINNNSDIKETDDSFFPKSAEISDQLLQAGLNQKQIELVYDLADKQVQPSLKQISDKLELDTKFKLDQHKLELRFGGHNNWQVMKNKIAIWAENNLPQEAMNTLTKSYDGVLAIVKLMQPNPNSGVNLPLQSETNTLSNLKTKMKDPRYWRDFDPAYRQRIKQGFEDIYESNDDDIF